ncbi:unnamed protein product [Rhizophagus irregularis]|nr:unnamed protein product [Rhizophagus irregularis]
MNSTSSSQWARTSRFRIDLLQTAKTVGVTEVKDEDIFKGIAQNAVQLESALSNRKRKASEMEEDNVFVGKTFGIITDAKEWYFMECSLDDQDRLKFKLSKPVTVVYDSKNMRDNVERVLGHIAWLLEEVQKPDSDFRSEERVVKKHRSSNLAEKPDARITELEAENAQNMELEWRAERTLSEKFRRDGVVFEPINEVEKLRHGIDELSYTVLSK